MKYYIFRETLVVGGALDPLAVKSTSYARAEAAFKKASNFAEGSKLEYREREVDDFEHYYSALEEDTPQSLFSLS